MDDDFYNEDFDSFDLDGEGFSSDDPFDGLTRRDQDLFFKVLDLLPQEQLEGAMDYFMEHPKKIRAVIAYVKAQKNLIKDKDPKELEKLLAQENIVIQPVQNAYDA